MTTRQDAAEAVRKDLIEAANIAEATFNGFIDNATIVAIADLIGRQRRADEQGTYRNMGDCE